MMRQDHEETCLHTRLTDGDAVYAVKISGQPENDGIVGENAADKSEIGQNERRGMEKFPEDIHLAHLDFVLAGIYGIFGFDKLHGFVIFNEEKENGDNRAGNGHKAEGMPPSPIRGDETRQGRYPQQYQEGMEIFQRPIMRERFSGGNKPESMAVPAGA